MLVTGEQAQVLVVDAIEAVQARMRGCCWSEPRQPALLKLQNSLERRLGAPLTPTDVAVLVSVRREYRGTDLD